MQEIEQIEGRNAVIELLESKKDINKIFVQNRRKTWINHKNYI